MSLKLRGIRRSYNRRIILRDVELDVPAGSIVTLEGGNGTGKTTLLRIAATHARPDLGALQVCGIDAKQHGAAARAHIGYVPHDPALYPDLSPREHLQFWAKLEPKSAGAASDAGRPATTTSPSDSARSSGIASVAKSSKRAELDDHLAAIGLTHVADQPCANLSRGQRQRLQIGIALLHRPRVLLLDEPFTGLDAAGAAWLEALLQSQARTGCAILLVLHDEAQAARLAHRRVRISNRRLEDLP